MILNILINYITSLLTLTYQYLRMYLFNHIKNLINWFQPDQILIEKLSVGIHEGARLCRLNIITALISSVIIFIMFLIRVKLEGLMSVTLYGLLAASIIISTLPFIIKRTGKYQVANIVLLTIVLIVIPIRILETGGFSSAVLSWYLGSGLIFFVIGSARLGVIAYVGSIFELCMIYLAIKLSWVTIVFKPSDDVQFWVFSLALTMSIAVIYWYEKQRLKNILELEEKNKKISSDNKLLATQKFKLERANLDKSTLLNVLCHDIGNPLHVIQAFAEFIEDDQPENPEVKNIIKGATVIKEIIDHVRLLQVADTKANGLELLPVKLSECIEQAIFIFDSKLKEKELSINYDKDLMEKMAVIAEPVSLSNFVINNIFSNAIKFSEKGSAIHFNAVIDNEFIHLSIQDHGIGMPPEIVDNLFIVSKLATRPGTQGETGTGLGMKVMNSYVNSFGGRVEIESVPKETDANNHGTIFHIWLKNGE